MQSQATFVDAYAPKIADPTKLPAAIRPRANKGVSIFDVYLGGDVRQIEEDAQKRPEHYSSEHHDTIRKLRKKEPVPTSQSGDLVLQYFRPSAGVALEGKVRTKMSRAQHPDPEEVPVFESQDFDDTIQIA